MIMGIAVEGVEAIPDLVTKHKVSQILLAIPSATRAKRKEIINSLVHLQAEVLTVPDLKEIVEGRAKIDELKDVEIEDLLGRDPVEPKRELLESNITDKVVLVTGAGGSIGSELCRQIASLRPKSLILFDLSEYGLYAIEREVRQIACESSFKIEIVPLLGSVQRINRLSVIFKNFKVNTVYHAAAYKHVPLVEYNVVEGVRNNIFGTYYAAKAAVEAVWNLLYLSQRIKRCVQPMSWVQRSVWQNSHFRRWQLKGKGRVKPTFLWFVLATCWGHQGR